MSVSRHPAQMALAKPNALPRIAGSPLLLIIVVNDDRTTLGAIPQTRMNARQYGVAAMVGRTR